MKNNIYALVIISIIIFTINSCNKDSATKYNPTIHEINIPAWAAMEGHLHEPSNNPTTNEGVALGKKLFFDTRLSGDNSMSCATCHNAASGFTDTRRYSKGIDGSIGNRNAMPLFNLHFANKFFWDGRRNSLEEQAHDPVTNPIEMKANWKDVAQKLQNDNMYPILFNRAFGTGIIDSNLVTKAIAQYERTLISFNSRFDQYYYNGDSSALNASEVRGLNLYFGKANCFLCHNAPLFTHNEFMNNGLDEIPNDYGLGGFTSTKSDIGKFKVPSLRNIAATGPYMHDGRFATLMEVIEFYNSGVNGNSMNIDNHMKFPYVRNKFFLTASEKIDLVNFLKSLTDEEFLRTSNQ